MFGSTAEERGVELVELWLKRQDKHGGSFRISSASDREKESQKEQTRMQKLQKAKGKGEELSIRFHESSLKGQNASCRVTTTCQCDECRPLCRNCEVHYENLVTCDFDDLEPTYKPAPISSSSTSASTSASTSTSVSGAVSRTGSSAQLSIQPAFRRAPPAIAPQPQQVTRLPIRPPSQIGRLAEPLRLPPTVSAGRIDPFESRPMSLEPAPSVDALMGHYLGNFAFRSFPFYASRPLIELWWPFVRGNEVLFNVVLLLSGLDRDHLREQYDSIHTRQLLDQCLTLLNARVQDPVAGVNDHTLVAIASLVAMEHDRGNMRALDMHLEGLKRVVELRGGLDMIRMTNAMAANIVFWCAMVSINEPALLPLTYGDQSSDLGLLGNPDIATLMTHDGGEKNLTDFGVDIVTANILHEVQRLSHSYTSTVNYGSPEEATNVLSYLCSVVERLLQMSRFATNDSPTPGLSQSCRLAGCLHIFTPLSGYFPDPTLMLHTLVRDLKASLTHMIRAVGTRSHLLLWLLSVGGITAHSMPERSWFVGHLVVVVTDLGIRDWQQMRQHLIQLAFHDNFCDISFEKLWEEVRRKQGLLSLTPIESMDWSHDMPQPHSYSQA